MGAGKMSPRLLLRRPQMRTKALHQDESTTTLDPAVRVVCRYASSLAALRSPNYTSVLTPPSTGNSTSKALQLLHQRVSYSKSTFSSILDGTAGGQRSEGEVLY